MKKSYILVLVSLMILTGCENKEESIRNEYITMKNEVLNEKNYEEVEIPFEIVTTVERVDEETVNYNVTIKEPKENMHDVKAMVVHNYYNEDVFPSIGVFDKPEELLLNNNDDNGTSELNLKDTIKTMQNISELDLELKLWIEYTNDNGEKKDIYYKTT